MKPPGEQNVWSDSQDPAQVGAGGGLLPRHVPINPNVRDCPGWTVPFHGAFRTLTGAEPPGSSVGVQSAFQTRCTR